jgi:hypothetical protein
VKNDVDSLDWGTIVAYTCEASCEGNVGYKEEHVWVQLSVSSDLDSYLSFYRFPKFAFLDISYVLLLKSQERNEFSCEIVV